MPVQLTRAIPPPVQVIDLHAYDLIVICSSADRATARTRELLASARRAVDLAARADTDVCVGEPLDEHAAAVLAGAE